MSRDITTEKDNHLSDAEFLNRYSHQIHLSPLLYALAERLQAYLNVGADQAFPNRKTCPVCEAELLVDIDYENNIITLHEDP